MSKEVTELQEKVHLLQTTVQRLEHELKEQVQVHVQGRKYALNSSECPSSSLYPEAVTLSIKEALAMILEKLNIDIVQGESYVFVEKKDKNEK